MLFCTQFDHENHIAFKSIALILLSLSFSALAGLSGKLEITYEFPYIATYSTQIDPQGYSEPKVYNVSLVEHITASSNIIDAVIDESDIHSVWQVHLTDESRDKIRNMYCRKNVSPNILKKVNLSNFKKYKLADLLMEKNIIGQTSAIYVYAHKDMSEYSDVYPNRMDIVKCN